MADYTMPGHTAATVLLVLGVPERTVMGIMGWSSTSMAARYQHVTDPIRQAVAAQVGGLLWADGMRPRMPTETRTETTAGRGPQSVEGAAALCLVRVAEDAGFEPARA